MEILEATFWETIQQILTAVLTGIGATAVAVLGAEVRQFFRQRRGNAQYAIVESVIRSAVLATEQQLKSTDGRKKLQYATSMAQNQLDSLGIQVDASTIGAQIEAIVFEELTRWHTVEEATPETA